MLHIMRHPYASEVFERCLSELDGSGHLVLTEDAVYAWLRSDPRLLELEQQSRLSVLSADVSARGIEVRDKVLVDYQAMVQLSVTHHPALTW